MVCLDTSFIIDLLRGNNKIQSLVRQLGGSSEDISVASPTIVEIVRGLKIGNFREGESEKVNELLSSLNVLNLDKESAILAGNVEADLIRKGEIIELEDILIGAIALHNNQTLITKNHKHFSRIKNLKVMGY